MQPESAEKKDKEEEEEGKESRNCESAEEAGDKVGGAGDLRPAGHQRCCREAAGRSHLNTNQEVKLTLKIYLFVKC